MSPVRDPRERSLRRMLRDGAAAAAEEAAGGRKPAARTGEDPVGDSSARPKIDRAALSDEDLDRLPLREVRRGRRDAPARRRLARLRQAPAAPAAPAGTGGEAVVVALSRGWAEVEDDDGARDLVQLPKALGRARGSELAVGDRVRLERRAGETVLAGLLPRASRLSRPDPLLAHHERILVANVDLAVVVASVRRPQLAPGLIDRFLVALAHGGVAPAIVVNKIDLVPEPRAADAELSRIEPYRALDLPILVCSTRTGEGIDELRDLLAGRWAAFVGHSGVGKSSLLNALAPSAAAAVGETDAKVGRGRHTTSRARIYRLPGGGRVVDTPGIREFGLWKLTAGELSSYFADLAALAPGCRFANCTHSHEPACAVAAAADAGRLDRDRYATYLRILRSLDGE